MPIFGKGREAKVVVQSSDSSDFARDLLLGKVASPTNYLNDRSNRALARYRELVKKRRLAV